MAKELLIDSSVPWFSCVATLGDRDYVLEFAFNTRDSRWYLSVAKADGTPLVSGIPIIVDFPLLNRFASEDLPDGMLIAIDSTGLGNEMVQHDLGQRVKLCWFSAEELSA